MSDRPGVMEPPQPRPAATLVVLRPSDRPAGPDGQPNLEVLLTRRPATMRFGPGMAVFPGGRLEADESHADAAVRETAEETGIEIDPARLVALTRWVTPLGLPARFDARFFATIAAPGTDVRHASAEVAEWVWLRPVDALEVMAAGRLDMWQPTVVTLQQLEGTTGNADLARRFGPRRTAADRALDGAGAASLSDTRAFSHRWAGGVEGRAGLTCVVGDHAWVVVDPGDPTGETAARIVAAAAHAGASLVGVVIGDLDPDRQAGVELFARGMGLPVIGPPGSDAIAPYPIIEATDGGSVPFGDAALIVEVEQPRQLGTGAESSSPRWADRAGRLRFRPRT